MLVDGLPRRAYLISGTDLALISQSLSSLLWRSLAGLDGGGQMPVEEYGVVRRATSRSHSVRCSMHATPRRFLRIAAPSLPATSHRCSTRTQRKELLAYNLRIRSTRRCWYSPILLSADAEDEVSLRRSQKRSATVASSSTRCHRAQTGPAPSGSTIVSPARTSGSTPRRGVAVAKNTSARTFARMEGISSPRWKRRLAAAPRSTPMTSMPFLGIEGGVAPWDLTDALDQGNASEAVHVLHRMLVAGGRHPLQVLSTLHRHFGAMLALDGAAVTDERGAVQPDRDGPFPARKAARPITTDSRSRWSCSGDRTARRCRPRPARPRRLAR